MADTNTPQPESILDVLRMFGATEGAASGDDYLRDPIAYLSNGSSDVYIIGDNAPESFYDLLASVMGDDSVAVTVPFEGSKIVRQAKYRSDKSRNHGKVTYGSYLTHALKTEEGTFGAHLVA